MDCRFFFVNMLEGAWEGEVSAQGRGLGGWPWGDIVRYLLGMSRSFCGGWGWGEKGVCSLGIEVMMFYVVGSGSGGWLGESGWLGGSGVG